MNERYASRGIHLAPTEVDNDIQIVVHESPTDHMNFQTKNFSYVTKEFGTFLDEIHAGGRQYLRAISSEKPTELPANLSTDFPGLKEDFLLPAQLSLVSENAHSSPLRISGPVTLWLHYDVSDLHLCSAHADLETDDRDITRYWPTSCVKYAGRNDLFSILLGMYPALVSPRERQVPRSASFREHRTPHPSHPREPTPTKP